MYRNWGRKGTVVSDNAAVYGKFSKAQKCWAHLLRKAIKLTLLDPKNKEYTDFADGAFQIFFDGRSLQKNQSISEDERESEIVKLENRVLAISNDTQPRRIKIEIKFDHGSLTRLQYSTSNRCTMDSYSRMARISKQKELCWNKALFFKIDSGRRVQFLLVSVKSKT